MSFHKQELPFTSISDQPDAVYARTLQEVLGGRDGEITVDLQYMFRGWNMHLPSKYRDLVFGIASEEIGHVEMPATMTTPEPNVVDNVKGKVKAKLDKQ